MSGLWYVDIQWSYCISVSATFWMWQGRLTTSSRGCLTTWMFGCMMTRRLTCSSIGMTHSSTSIKLSKKPITTYFAIFKFSIYLFILFSTHEILAFLRELFIMFYLYKSQLTGIPLNCCSAFDISSAVIKTLCIRLPFTCISFLAFYVCYEAYPRSRY